MVPRCSSLPLDLHFTMNSFRQKLLLIPLSLASAFGLANSGEAATIVETRFSGKTLTATIVDLPSGTLHVYFDGQLVSANINHASGIVTAIIRQELPAGNYALQVK